MKKVILHGTYLRCIMQKMTLSLVFVLYASLMQAQVNVGANEDALSGAIMQWKQTTNVAGGAANATGGLAFPRVTLQDINLLAPIVPVSPETALSYTGLVVYNVATTNGLTPGLNQWDGTKWVPLVQTQATFLQVNCNDIVVNGTYGAGTPVNGQNYITLNLTVATPGAFSIAAKASNSSNGNANGYSFYLSGMALETGPLTLNLPAQGVPTNAETDNLIFTGITTSVAPCPQTIIVLPSSTFSINCSATPPTVLGAYSKGVALVPSVNQIAVNVTPTATGAWYMSTVTDNGMTFSGSGNFTTANTTQTVYLNGTGTPISNTSTVFAISGASNACSATVNATPTITYAIISDGGIYSFGSGPRMGALASPSNFGPHGTCNTVGQFNLLWTANSTRITSGPANGSVTASIISTATSAPGSLLCPDIIFYFSYAAYPSYDPNLMPALAAYVNAGGCLIFGAELDQGAGTALAPINALLSGIFGTGGAIGQTASGSNNDYLINAIPNDPIVNLGPFGNLNPSSGSLFWAEDGGANTSTVVPVSSLPTNSVAICYANAANTSNGGTSANAIVWYNTSKNFVFFGDSGGSEINNSSTSSFPSIFTASPTFLPIEKSYVEGSGQNIIANSQLEMNAAAWAIGRALTNGINPH